MALSKALTGAKFRFVERVLPDADAATVETMEILMDVEQISTLLASFEDLRKGRLVTSRDAFADL